MFILRKLMILVDTLWVSDGFEKRGEMSTYELTDKVMD